MSLNFTDDLNLIRKMAKLIEADGVEILDNLPPNRLVTTEFLDQLLDKPRTKGKRSNDSDDDTNEVCL